MNATVPEFLQLKPGRVHEASGPGATSFAAVAAARSGGDVLWVLPGHAPGRLNPQGLSQFFDPARLLLVDALRHDDALAVAEEALRSGAVALVVADLSKPLGLTPGRRLQLAAGAGQATGLCLIPEAMGSNVAETRWLCEPRFGAADSTLMRWRLNKNKSGTTGAWDVRWNHASRRLDLVSASGDGPGFAGAPG